MINKFHSCNFDKFGAFLVDGRETEIRVSINTIYYKFNNKVQYGDKYLEQFRKYTILGKKWELLAREIANERFKNIQIHKQYSNNYISDISTNKKIIECKLCAEDREIFETIIKYGKYTNNTEIWSLKAFRKYKKRQSLNIREIQTEMEKDAIYFFHSNNINLKLKILLCYEDEIFKEVNNK